MRLRTIIITIIGAVVALSVIRALREPTLDPGFPHGEENSDAGVSAPRVLLKNQENSNASPGDQSNFGSVSPSHSRHEESTSERIARAAERGAGYAIGGIGIHEGWHALKRRLHW